MKFLYSNLSMYRIDGYGQSKQKHLRIKDSTNPVSVIKLWKLSFCQSHNLLSLTFMRDKFASVSLIIDENFLSQSISN